MKLRGLSLSLALLIACALPVWADIISKPTAGVMCRPNDAIQIPAEGTKRGWIFDGGTGDFAFVSDSRKVPAIVGIAMGVSAHTLDDRLYPVEITVTHPPLPDSDDTTDVWITDFNPGRARVVYWDISSEQERVVGDYNISARYQGKTLYSVDFELVAPQSVPHLITACTH